MTQLFKNLCLFCLLLNLAFSLSLFNSQLFAITARQEKCVNCNLQTGKIIGFTDFKKVNHYRQSLNNCGPYSITTAINLLTDSNLNPQDTVKSISWRLPNYFTHPWGLEEEARKNGLESAGVNASQLSDKEKIEFLKKQIAEERVVILYVKQPKSGEYYRHFITLLGFSQDKFFIYDSLVPRDEGSPELTIDENGGELGNRSYSYDELLKIWNEGVLFGNFNNYALVVGS